MSPSKILALCNPLLDLTVDVSDDFLQRHSLQPNHSIQADARHDALFQELRDSQTYAQKVQSLPGGSAQNTIRVAQWLLQDIQATAMFGTVGNDSHADVMIRQARREGINVVFARHPSLPTGTCAVMISKKGTARSLVSALGAARTFDEKFLELPHHWALVLESGIFYIAGFSFTVSPGAMFKIARHSLSANKTFCLNLSAPFLIQNPMIFQSMCELLPYVDVCFGNDSEALELCKAMQWPCTSVDEIAVQLTKQPFMISGRPRTVIITQGSDPTVVAIGDTCELRSLQWYPVIPCPHDELVDTNGAGDAFAGGVLAGMARAEPWDACIARANYAASVIVRRQGTTLPTGFPHLMQI